MTSDTLEQRNLGVSPFGFSAERLDDLGASEYTLVTVAIDDSASVRPFKSDIVKCMKEIVDACRKSPRADNLMLRVISFGSRLEEAHGFKQLINCNPNDYDNTPPCGGATALYDGVVNSVEAIGSYGKALVDNDLDVNGIVIIITDGMDNGSTNNEQQCKDGLKQIVMDEDLESLVSILVGVNVQDTVVEQYLEGFEKSVGFTQYVKLGDASSKTLAKLAQFISKSISAQSQALGTGGPSESINIKRPSDTLSF